MFHERDRRSFSLLKAIIVSGALLLLLLVLKPAPKAVAIPAFARKYQTASRLATTILPS